MAAVLRAVALGLLALAVTLHVVGFVTNGWISSKLDKRGIESIMSANGMGAMLPDQVGMSINMGLWKFCMHVNLGQAVPGVGATTDMCKSPDSGDVPDWMKAVQALGILALITAVLGIASIIYSFIGDSKGDRARLLPYITGAICLLAGILLLIAVTVYATEYDKMMEDQMSMMGSASPGLRTLFQNVKDNTSLGYSFALETISGVMMVVVSMLLVIPSLRDGSSAFGGPRNLAV